MADQKFSQMSYSSTTVREAQKKIGNLPFNTVTGNYTLVAADEQKAVEVNSASPVNITVPSNASVPFQNGTSIPVIWYGAGQPTIVPAVGVTILSDGPDNVLPTRYRPVMLVKRSTNEWYLWGIGTPASSTPDTTAPTITAFTTATANRLDATLDENTTGTTGFTFTLNGGAITPTGISNLGTSIRFTFAETFIAGDDIDWAYAPGNVVDDASNALAADSGTVTNSLGAVQLSTPTLTATTVDDDQIDLSWTNVANESSYKLEWSPNGTSGWTQIGGTIAANTLVYSHTGLTPSTQYFYRITAVGDGVSYTNSAFGTDDATTDAAGDVTAPELVSIVVEDAEPTHVVHTFDEALTANSPTLASIVIKVNGSPVTVDAFYASGTTVTAELSAPIVNGDVVLSSYTAGATKIEDAAGNDAANWTDEPVTNNVAAGSLLDTYDWEHWYDPSDGVYHEDADPATDGETIKHFYDQINPGGASRPNANDLIEDAVSGTRAIYDTAFAGMNNLPVIKIDTSKVLNTSYGSSIARPMTKIVVCQFNTLPASVSYVLMHSASRADVGHNGDTPRKFIMYGGSAFGTGTITPVTGQTYILWAEYLNDGTGNLYVYGNGANGTLDINGVSIGGAATAINAFGIGYTSFCADAYVGDVLVYDGLVSSGDRGTIAGELATKWGVDITP